MYKYIIAVSFIVLFVFIIFLIAGCKNGKEIARIPFHEKQQQHYTLNLLKGDQITFWTDLYVEYKQRGFPEISYDIKITKEGRLIEHLVLDVVNDSAIKLNYREASMTNGYMLTFEGKMKSRLIEENGDYELDVTLIYSDHELDFGRADLVIRKKNESGA